MTDAELGEKLCYFVLRIEIKGTPVRAYEAGLGGLYEISRSLVCH